MHIIFSKAAWRREVNLFSATERKAWVTISEGTRDVDKKDESRVKKIGKSTVYKYQKVSEAAGASAQTAGQWGQCGGIGWTGATLCPTGWYCSVINPYYSQCLQGTATTTTSAGGGGGTTTTTAQGGSATLMPGYSFIRAVEDPNFHKYLQSEVLSTASDAVLGSPSTAGQFKITGGQLIQDANGTPLYAVVESRANSTVMKLKMSWSTTPATAGTFDFSGDTLEWSIPTISRPQNNAWLVCPDAQGHADVYVNLGPYAYQTPAGCADETIHAYTGATATP
ncbi:putative fungal-type cellulose-binding domain containing protein [Lyophyllum shimeji]|uniref:Fungal-type cellulose-binding domain containing protein n=1 Tax=Lyophyllum shimeji TaxID=47721 RepID=A0A9P3PUN1_LYOSH|nr:putative fungal-type cellulose-binding domain containing protein [Lyophyllum shimeji]